VNPFKPGPSKGSSRSVREKEASGDELLRPGVQRSNDRNETDCRMSEGKREGLNAGLL